MRAHFASRHKEHTIIIDEEGLSDRCRFYGLFGKTVLRNKHVNSKTCMEGAIKRRRYYEQEVVDIAREGRLVAGGAILKQQSMYH